MKQNLQCCAFAALVGLVAIPEVCLAGTLRIGVFGLFHPRELILRPAANGVLLLEGGGGTIALADGRTARLSNAEDVVECRVGQRLISSAKFRASSRSGSDAEFILSVPGKIERRYRGTLEVLVARGTLHSVVVMDREVAVASAVAAEAPPGASLEALKAQAVVTRSYYAATRGRHAGFDFCDSTHCQLIREPATADSLAALATTATRDLMLLYGDSVVAALFSASCGGRTRTPHEIGLRAEGYPYFAVDCSPCLHRARRWQARLDSKVAAPLLADRASENARLGIGRRLGWNVVPGNNYSAWSEGESIVVQGRGAGHGLGLCQLGAAAMAQEGAGFQQILTHYYPNTRLGSKAVHANRTSAGL